MVSDRTICFLLPGNSGKPNGGLRVVYEYANRLSRDGMQVHLCYCRPAPERGNDVFKWLRRTALWVFNRIFPAHISGRRWFPLDRAIKEHSLSDLSYRSVVKADVYVATYVNSAFYLKDYPVDPSRKFYLIQGYEVWGPFEGKDAEVRSTYHFGFRNLVISRWLQILLEKEEKVGCTLLRNGFDFDYFKMSKAPEERDGQCVSMMYSEQPLKGCAIAMEALKTVYSRRPGLRVLMFGVPARPKDLPDWMEYHSRPGKEEHNRIYNDSAIYIAPGLNEGWGLTVGEAMACGAAVICSDIAGYKEMATDGETALLFPAGDSSALAERILALMEDDGLRTRLARAGHEHIAGFTWDSSYAVLKSLLDQSFQ